MFVVKTPVLTEKTFESIKRNVYVFLVDPKARKETIKRQIEYIFNVKVAKVNTLQEPKKSKRIFRNKGYLPRNKRAIVTLEKGYGIQIYPQQNRETEVEENLKTQTFEEAPLNLETQNLAAEFEENLADSTPESATSQEEKVEKSSKAKRKTKAKVEVEK